MSKVVVSQLITLVGVVEDPGGSEDLDRGGWAFEFDRADTKPAGQTLVLIYEPART